MLIQVVRIGETEFLDLGVLIIPVSRIKKFDFGVANGGATGNSVQIVTDDPDEEIIFAYENRDTIKRFLDETV